MPSEADLDLIAKELMTPEEADPEATESQAHEDEPPESPPDPEAATAEDHEPLEVTDDDEPEAPASKGLTAEFYAQKVPGTELTYGEFKDRVKDLAAADTVRTELEGEQSEFRNERMQFKRLQQLMGQQVTPEQQQQMLAYEQAGRAREAELILTAIPSWQEEATVLADAGDISKDWSRYGVTDSEIKTLLATDARFAKREYDLLQERKRLATAQTKVKAASKKRAQSPTRAVNTNQKQQLEALSNDSNASPEDRQLAALIGGLS